MSPSFWATAPEVGYVVMDGIAEPARVRFAFHTDTDLDRLSQPDAIEGPLLAPVGYAA
jgi:hypothetical protein